MKVKDIMQKEFLTFDAESSIREMLGKLSLTGKRSGMVFKNGKYYGILDRRALLKNRIAGSNSKILKCSKKVPVLNVDSDILLAAELMNKTGLDYLPIEEDRLIVGFVRGIDVLNELSKKTEFKKIKVDNVKLVKPSPLKETDKISNAINNMLSSKVDQVPIFEERELIGTIKLKDLYNYFIIPSEKSSKTRQEGKTRAAVTDKFKKSSLQVKSFSSINHQVTRRSVPLHRAVNQMVLNNTWDMIVKEDNKVFGLLSVRNILSHLSRYSEAVNYQVNFTGLNDTDLGPGHIMDLERVAKAEAGKLQKKIKNELLLNIRIKEKKKAGKKGKQRLYTVTLRMEYPGQVLTASYEDWNVHAAMQTAFTTLKNKVLSKFRK